MLPGCTGHRRSPPRPAAVCCAPSVGARSSAHSPAAAYPARTWRPGTVPADLSTRDKRLLWANWPLYIDKDDKHPNRRPTLEEFERSTGIAVD